MNIRQKQIILTALFLLTLFVLFPPWVYEHLRTSREYPAGYHFLFSPPEVKPDAEMRKRFSIPDVMPASFIVKKDLLHFTAQIIAVPFLAIGFLLILADKKSLGKIIVGSIFVFVGGLFTVLVCLMSLR
jgi:hypothetical protein